MEGIHRFVSHSAPNVLLAVFVLLLCVNLTAFALFGIDKYKAQHGRWRISEQALLLSALLGGSVGALLGMRLFHHKTLHRRFRIGLPLILLLQLSLCLCIFVFCLDGRS